MNSMEQPSVRKSSPEGLGDCLREIRRRLFLSQSDLARLLGVSYVSLNRWKNGCYEPSPLAIGRLRDFCQAACQKQPHYLPPELVAWVESYQRRARKRKAGRENHENTSRSGRGTGA